VKKIGLFPKGGGYADLVVADTATLTFVSLKNAVTKRQFKLADVEWPVAALANTGPKAP
jgi:hypothetical protein